MGRVGEPVERRLMQCKPAWTPLTHVSGYKMTQLMIRDVLL